MRALIRLHLGALALALLAATVTPPAVQAFSSGITTATFGMTGCPLCHSGGTLPTVTLSGPSPVDPGTTHEYMLTIFNTNPMQNYGGLNVSAIDGTLSVGGSDSANTQTLPGPTSLAEITHSAPKAADIGNVVTFTFEWTAPASFTSVTLDAWGNSVNLNFSASGDRAAMDSLEVFSSDADTPTPSPTPTATPPPLGCADLEPLKPSLVADAAARKCQEAIAKAGRVYLKKDLKFVQKCLKAIHKGKLTGDPGIVCVGDAGTLPTDPGTHLKLGGAQAKANAAVAAKCTDTTVAPLSLCAATLSGLQTCLTASHRQRVVDAATSEYGAVAPSADAGVRACQNAIAGAARKFLVGAAGAAQKCLNARNKDGVMGDAAARCLGSVAGGTYVAPTDTKTAEKIAKSEDKLRAKILAKCTDAQIAALDGCGSDRSTAADCTVCTHRADFFSVIGDEYGGS